MHSATAFTAVKFAAARFYLDVAGVQSLRSAARKLPVTQAADMGTPRVPASRSWREGFLTNLLNPKVIVFYLALLPQFIGADDPVFGKSLLLAAIHAVEGIAWFAIVSHFVDRSRSYFLRPQLRRWIDAACGTVLVALGLRLATQRQ